MLIYKEKTGFKLIYIAEDGSISGVDWLRVHSQNLSRFAVGAVYRASPMKIDFEGRPYGDHISGKLRFEIAGKAGELPVVGKRKKTVD
ncbi:MAG: hypothetical protein P8N76_16155 [Pirellulaceae bacterium]|nr:hypothetical protein [Pirellulaceae bacterium]